MPLPDASRLTSLGDERWRALGQRLSSIGVSNQTIANVTRPIERVAYELRGPLRVMHLRKHATEAAWALRLFAYGDPVTEREARAVLGDDLFSGLAEIGAIETVETSWVSPFLLTLHADLYVFVDDLTHGDDAVMGSGSSTLALSRAAVPSQRKATALDFGCGAGPSALALARQVDHVVGLDINPRAITLARVNAALNGIDNVELVVGDMFEAVRDRRFDVIVSQPPFVARHEGSKASTYLHGGARGDELPMRVLAEAPKLLADDGVLVTWVEWPELASDDLTARLRSGLPSRELDLLVLRGPRVSTQVHAAGYAAAEHPLLDEAFATDAEARLTHFERHSVIGVRPTITVVRRQNARASGFDATIDVRGLEAIFPSRLRVDRFLAAHTLLQGDDAALFAAKLRVPKRTSFVEERDTPSPEAPPTFFARFSDKAMVTNYPLAHDSFLFLSLVHMSESAAAAAAFVAENWNVTIDEARQKLAPHLRSALAHGALEIG